MGCRRTEVYILYADNSHLESSACESILSAVSGVQVNHEGMLKLFLFGRCTATPKVIILAKNNRKIPWQTTYPTHMEILQVTNTRIHDSAVVTHTPHAHTIRLRIDLTLDTHPLQPNACHLPYHHASPLPVTKSPPSSKNTIPQHFSPGHQPSALPPKAYKPYKRTHRYDLFETRTRPTSAVMHVPAEPQHPPPTPDYSRRSKVTV
jgi:hypothetical protein